MKETREDAMPESVTPTMLEVLRAIHAAPETGYEGKSSRTLGALAARGLIERTGLHGRYRASAKGCEFIENSK